MSSITLIPAVLAAMAAFAWSIRQVKLPRLLVVVEKLSSYGTSGERHKALRKRMEASGIPVSAEMLTAGKNVLLILLGMMGVFLLLNRRYEGMFFLCALPLAGKLPGLMLDLWEKKRKEAILEDVPLMVEQVKVYAKAAGYYNALKVVAKSWKGYLGSELALFSAEMELVGMIEALDNFAKRCGIEEIDDFARIITVEQCAGADINEILSNYIKMVRQRKAAKIKRKIKLQPILMSLLPGALIVIYIMMFVVPMVGSILNQLNTIK